MPNKHRHIPGRQVCDIVLDKIFLDAVISGVVDRLVVGDGSLDLRCIFSNDDITIEVEPGNKEAFALFLGLGDAVIGVDDADIGIAVIGRIPLTKT